MSSRKIATSLVFMLIIIGLGLQIVYWPQLPARVATHFGKDGNPNDWMNKSIATILNCGLVVIIPLFFMAIGSLLRGLPTALINIPNREYWFAPERREQSLQWISTIMSWFAVAIASLVVVVNHLTFVANRDGESLRSSAFLTALVVFLVTTFCIVAIMIRRFRRPPLDALAKET